VTANGEPVGTFLVEDGLQEMRKYGCNQGRQQDVISRAALVRALAAGVEPPRSGKGAKYMFVSAPSEKSSQLFRRRIGA
jgi:hypothetical protein